MKNNKSISNIKKRSPVLIPVSIFSIFTGLMFFIIQSGKLFAPEEAEIEILKLPMGLYDRGYVWSDTIIAVPSLFIGGILRIWGNKAMGHLLVFTGFAINLYAMIFLFIGFKVLGSPLVGFDLYLKVIWTLLGILSMIYCARYIVILTNQNN